MTTNVKTYDSSPAQTQQHEIEQQSDMAPGNNAIAEGLPQSNDPLATEGDIFQPNGIPTLNIQTIVGVFNTEEEAQAAAEALKQAGYAERQAQTVNEDPEQPVNVNADETGVNQGMMLGGTAGAIAGAALLGLTTVALPAAGAALALGGAISGHVTGAVAGAAVGGVVGATAGGYKGMEPAADRAQAHADDAQADEMQGGFVVALKIPVDDSPDKALDILKQQGARETNVFGPAL